MNKLLFVIFLILSIGLYIFNVDQYLTKNFVFLNDAKKIYVEQLESIEKSIDKFFFQSEHIEELQIKNEELGKYKALYEKYYNQSTTLSNSFLELKEYKDQMQFAKVLSYLEFDDFTKVWLDLEKNDSNINGLIAKDYAAGIVVNKKDRALALLNGNEKSNYAVYIGKNKAPGITHGIANENELLIKFIPIWIDIKIGDEVITSGMDNIFFKGLKVGKVSSIKKFADMQEATIEPYINVLNQNYFYIYSKKLEDLNTTKNSENNSSKKL